MFCTYANSEKPVHSEILASRDTGERFPMGRHEAYLSKFLFEKFMLQQKLDGHFAGNARCWLGRGGLTWDEKRAKTTG